MMNKAELEARLENLEKMEWRIQVETDFLTWNDRQRLTEIRTEKREIREQLKTFK